MSVVIVGAGAAGLACARVLHERGIDFQLFESASEPGGRLATDVLDGFALDRGFQILLTSYPEVRRFVDLPSLQLGNFCPGATIRQETGQVTFPNPLSRPWLLPQTMLAPVGSLFDKAKVGLYLARLLLRPVEPGPSRKTASERLRLFSPHFRRNFLHPFWAGVFLDEELQTNSTLLDFLFRLFALGEAALPAGGMQNLARQLAAPLPRTRLHFNTEVSQIQAGSVLLQSGQRIEARHVVDATNRGRSGRFHSTQCTYFAAPRSPLKSAYLLLNPNRDSPVHHLAVLSDVARGYAPAGQSLVSVSHVGLARIPEEEMRRELTRWFGAEVAGWRHLRTYHLDQALPVFDQENRPEPLQVGDGFWRCGDGMAYPSLNGALRSGREVGQSLLS